MSGPNEGQNLGTLILFSGTVGVVQYAGSQGIPAIALSAGQNTADNRNLANPNSLVVANHAVKLIKELQVKAGGGSILPARTLLNVNFPNNVSSSTTFAFAKMGTYDGYMLKFNNKVPYGLTGAMNNTQPNASQKQDETLVSQNKISVTAMQVGYDHRPAGQEWLKVRLRNLLAK